MDLWTKASISLAFVQHRDDIGCSSSATTILFEMTWAPKSTSRDGGDSIPEAQRAKYNDSKPERNVEGDSG